MPRQALQLSSVIVACALLFLFLRRGTVSQTIFIVSLISLLNAVSKLNFSGEHTVSNFFQSSSTIYGVVEILVFYCIIYLYYKQQFFKTKRDQDQVCGLVV